MFYPGSHFILAFLTNMLFAHIIASELRCLCSGRQNSPISQRPKAGQCREDSSLHPTCQRDFHPISLCHRLISLCFRSNSSHHLRNVCFSSVPLSNCSFCTLLASKPFWGDDFLWELSDHPTEIFIPSVETYQFLNNIFNLGLDRWLSG